MSEYVYLGDRLTYSWLKGRGCDAVRRGDGKCIRGRNGNMLVEFHVDGRRAVVLGRRLRRVDRLMRKADGNGLRAGKPAVRRQRPAQKSTL